MQPISAAPLAAPRDGLAGVAGNAGPGVFIPDSDPLDAGNRWSAGFTPEGVACSPGYVSDLSCTDPGLVNRTFRGRYTVGEPGQPFIIGEGIECSTMGTGHDLTAWNNEARAALDRVRWVRIAHELWTGAKSTRHQRLADQTATVLSATPVSVVEAIGALEDAMASSQAGGPDLLHFPRKAVAYLGDAGQLVDGTPTSGRLYTHNGSLIVADRGYPGTGPHGEQPTAETVWAYATGPIAARLGPVTNRATELAESINPETNDQLVLAEQQVAVGWLCTTYAIPVALNC